MINHRIIRSIITGGLLALFALAITPKIMIHALVAHHTDVHLRLDHDKGTQLNTAGFHCATDNQVVESPFSEHSFSLQIAIAPSFPAFRPGMLQAPLASSHPLFGLRGPPAGFMN